MGIEISTMDEISFIFDEGVIKEICSPIEKRKQIGKMFSNYNLWRIFS